MPPPRQDSHATRFFAFTLAEVLITLGIIGVVAALIMPTLIQNHKKNVTVNQLKATYSIFSQAINTSRTENGDLSTWDFTLNNIDFANKYVLPYLKVIETKNKNGWQINTLYNSHSGYLYWNYGINTNPIYIMSNGIAFSVSNGVTYPKYISVDINGKKAPNVLGLDCFVFILDTKRNQLVPFGFGLSKDILLGKVGNHDAACIRDNNWQYYRGMYCAAVIMNDGWKISDDYPWQK